MLYAVSRRLVLYFISCIAYCIRRIMTPFYLLTVLISYAQVYKDPCELFMNVCKGLKLPKE